MAAKPAPDPSDRASELEHELAQIKAAAVAGEAVLMRLDPGGQHSAFQVGQVTVTADPSPVPAHAVEPLLTAAAEAGVTLLFAEA